MTEAHDRDRWITQDDGLLLSECMVDAYLASGPGGQKRNKTSSTVRLGLTTGQLSKFIVADGKLLAAAKRVRQAAGLHPMTVTR